MIYPACAPTFEDVSQEVDRIIGRPYQLDGRGPHAFNCLGVLYWLFRRFGVELPDPVGELAHGADDADARARALHELHRAFVEVDAEELEPLDAVVREGQSVPAELERHLERWLPRDPELAVVEAPSIFVSAVHEGNVVRVPARDFLGPRCKAYRYGGWCE